MGMNKLEICFRDRDGNTILKKKLSGLPLKDEKVIAKSMEWFNDPEPCMIHRSAVMKRILMEFSEYLDTLIRQEIHMLSWEHVPDHLKQMLEIGSEIDSILLVDSDLKP